MGRISNKALLEKITIYLLEKGVRPNLKGFRYLRRAIELTIKNGCLVLPVTKVLYPKLSEEFGDTASKVERSIRHAIQTSNDSKYPNSEFIGVSSLNICMNKIGE